MARECLRILLKKSISEYAFYLIFDYFDFDLFSALLFYTRINSELTYDDICYDSYYHNDF